MDSLEHRRLLSGGGSGKRRELRDLEIEGTTGDDVILLNVDGANLVVNLNGTSTSYTLANYREVEVEGGRGNDLIEVTGNIALRKVKLEGEQGNDTLTGGAGNEELKGGDGDDLLTGGAGNDKLEGGRGTDQVTGGAGSDRFHRSDATSEWVDYDVAADRLDGERRGDGRGEGKRSKPPTNGNSFVREDGRNIRIRGTANSDIINVSFADNVFTVTLNGTTTSYPANRVRSIEVQGRGGDDSVVVADSVTVKTRLKGDTGNETLVGGSGRDELKGGDGNDSLVGNIGNDKLDGDEGNDVLLGGEGNDKFESGEGLDSMTGGLGSDKFELKFDDGDLDTEILDFSDSEDEKETDDDRDDDNDRD
jgi:trimeric autotransporter adhesin